MLEGFYADVLGKIVGGLLLLAATFVLAIPARLIKWSSSFLKKHRARKRLGAGLIDDATLDGAIQYYVRPKYQNVDPSNEIEPYLALVSARDDLFGMMRRFLSDSRIDERYMLLFADSGMGKTSFLINYFAENYGFAKFRRHEILLVSLSQKISDDLVRTIDLAKRKDTNLFLDALDEDPRALGDVAVRLQEILELTEGFRRVVITCRTQFFLSDEVIPKSTKVSRAGPTPANRSKHYAFIRAYLSPFDDSQVKSYLRERFPGLLNLRLRRRAQNLVNRVPSLSVRPMLLSHMPELLDAGIPIERSVDVYEAMVSAWATREKDWIDPAALIRFSQHLALDFYQNREHRGGEFASSLEVVAIANSYGITLPPIIVTSRSLLNRTADGNCKFAHRSIMEYFVCRCVIEADADFAISLTDQMAKFLLESLGCLSVSVGQLLGVCNVRVVKDEVVRRIGYATNFGLYRALFSIDEPTKILSSIPVGVEGLPAVRNIQHLVEDMISAAFRMNMKDVREIRIGVKPNGSGDAGRVYITVWVNSYAVICETDTSMISVSRASNGLAFPRNHFVVRGSNMSKARHLDEFDWSVESRVSVDAAVALLGEELRSFDDNPAVGFQYTQEENVLTIRHLAGRFMEDSLLSEFGIMDEARLMPVDNRSYGMLGPKLMRAF